MWIVPVSVENLILIHIISTLLDKAQRVLNPLIQRVDNLSTYAITIAKL